MSRFVVLIVVFCSIFIRSVNINLLPLNSFYEAVVCFTFLTVCDIDELGHVCLTTNAETPFSLCEDASSNLYTSLDLFSCYTLNLLIYVGVIRFISAIFLIFV